MYAYLVDGFLQDRKYQPELFRIESRLGQLGIQGRFDKITILKNLVEAAQDAVRRGATTLVAIGNDETVIKLLPVAIERGLTLGLVPLGQPQTIAHAAGIPTGLAACDILSRRVVQRLDVGQVDNQYFLLEARLASQTAIECDGKYTVEALDPDSQVIIGNLGLPGASLPTRGRLELVIQSGARGFWQRGASRSSVFPIKRATLRSSVHSSLVLDGQLLMKSPSRIGLATKKLNLIVGRGRTIGN